jgi:type IV secretory pathway TrbF-like protein
MSLIGKPSKKAQQPTKKSADAGRVKKEHRNPYLDARRTWNEHVGGVVSSRQSWQVLAILSLLITLAAVGGIIHIGSQSKFIPYIVEVDKLGQVAAMAPAERVATVDPRIVHATVAFFIKNARLVTPDITLQRKAVFQVYSMLAPNLPATAKMNEYLNATPEVSPFRRAETEMVSVEISVVLPQTANTWQVDWVETVRDRQGEVKEKPYGMRALVTIFVDPSTQTTEAQILNNPLGIYVKDFSWSKER